MDLWSTPATLKGSIPRVFWNPENWGTRWILAKTWQDGMARTWWNESVIEIIRSKHSATRGAHQIISNCLWNVEFGTFSVSSPQMAKVMACKCFYKTDDTLDKDGPIICQLVHDLFYVIRFWQLLQLLYFRWFTCWVSRRENMTFWFLLVELGREWFLFSPNWNTNRK